MVGWTKAISCSTFGKMRATITPTPARAGMQPVALRQAEVGGDAVEEEGIEQHAVFGRQARDRCARRTDRSRRRDWARRAYRTTERRYGASVRRLRILSSASRVTCGLIPRSMSLAPSSRMTASVPSGTDQSSRASPSAGGIAGNAGILDLRGDSLVGERGLQARHEAILGGQAETCRQRVAERHDLDRLRRVRAGRRCCSQQRNATNRRTRDLDAEFSATHMIGHRRDARGARLSRNYE
jgi:hypothetical protein